MKMQNSTIATILIVMNFAKVNVQKNSENTGRKPSSLLTLSLFKFPSEFTLNSLAFQSLKSFGESDQQRSQNQKQKPEHYGRILS